MSRALSQPIENLADPNEQIALSLIAHLAPSLGPWRKGEDLRGERDSLGQREPGLSKDVGALHRRVQELNSQASQVSKSGAVIGPILVGILALALAPFVGGWGGPAAIIGIGAIVFGFYHFGKKKGSIVEQGTREEGELVRKNDDLTKTKARLAAIEKELQERHGAFPEVEVARVGFPIRKARIVGFDTLIDLSATLPSVELSTIDLSKVGDRLLKVSEEARRLVAVPILMAPKSAMKNAEALDRLYGEEDRLRELVDIFVETLSAVDDIKIRLPLVPAGGEIARRMTAGNFTEVSDKGLVQLQADVADINQIAGFVSQVNAAKTAGEQVLSGLKETYQALFGACEAYSVARMASINHMHAQVFDVLNRASWCSKRFYCPRTIQSPAYLQTLLKVDIEDAHELDFDELIARLNSDAVIAKRLKDKPETLDVLWSSYRSVVDFSPNLLSDSLGATAPTQLACIQDQYDEHLKEFRGTLLGTICGSMNPVLTFSAESRLFYDPETEQWRSHVVPYSYATNEVQHFGQVLKIHTDLLFPLWERLWTEKADFRKAEHFRTNESLARMSEKESEKLLEIGNQFRADMRPVRENVYHIESELKAKGDDIRQFRDAMKELGVLTERQLRHLNDDFLRQVTIGDGSVLKRAEEIESWLAFEPKSQAERRGSVRDPIDIARAPDVLIGYSLRESEMTRLALPGVHQ